MELEESGRERIYESKFSSEFNKKIRSIIRRNKIEKDEKIREDVWKEVKCRRDEQQLLTSMPIVIDRRRALKIDLMNLDGNGIVSNERLKGKIALYFGEDISHNQVRLNIFELCYLTECGYVLPFYGNHQLTVEELIFKLLLRDPSKFFDYFIFSYLQRQGFVVIIPRILTTTTTTTRRNNSDKLKRLKEGKNKFEKNRKIEEIIKLLGRENRRKKCGEYHPNSIMENGDGSRNDPILFHLYNKSNNNYKKSEKDKMNFTGNILTISKTNYIHLPQTSNERPFLLPLISSNFSTLTYHFITSELNENK
ncbi:hypothetical protein SNEBB_001088 [Seison nebaliae]|nr:hypothetical protein SNEBB_001088 [Seison nebaliae]